jgi:hypothetical protein
VESFLYRTGINHRCPRTLGTRAFYFLHIRLEDFLDANSEKIEVY